MAPDCPRYLQPTRLGDVPEDGESDIRSLMPSTSSLTDDVTDHQDTGLASADHAFFQAIHDGDLAIVRRHLNEDVDIEQLDDRGQTPLIVAMRSRQLSVARLLLQSGANVHHRVAKRPPLVHAITEHESCVTFMQLLLDYDAVLHTVSGSNVQNALHWAAQQGSPRAAEYLLHKGFDIEEQCGTGLTPLMIAAVYGHASVVKVLIAHGAVLEARDEQGDTALVRAVNNRFPEVVKVLLENGADANSRNRDGHSALTLAAQFDLVVSADILLDHGANVDIRCDVPEGATSAMVAACFNSTQVLKSLIARNADLNLRSTRGDTALSVAIGEHHRKVVEILLQAVAGDAHIAGSVALEVVLPHDVGTIEGVIKTISIMYTQLAPTPRDERNEFAWLPWLLDQSDAALRPFVLRSLLRISLRKPNEALLRALIVLNIDLNGTLIPQHTPLLYAINNRNCSLEVVQILLDAGADVNERIRDEDGDEYTALERVIMWMDESCGADETSVAVLDMLLQSRRCFLNKEKRSGCTTLDVFLERSGGWPRHRADRILHRILEAVPYSAEDVDEDSSTPLMVAVRFGRADIIEMLLDRGADLEAAANVGMTPFIAASRWAPEQIPFLVTKGANIYARDKFGRSALHIAAAAKHVDAVEALLNLGLSIDDMTCDGDTPLTSALANNAAETALQLLQRGASITWRVCDRHDTALHMSARYGLFGVVAHILRRGGEAHLEATNRQGQTPLHKACISGSLPTINLLLAAGANMESYDNCGNSALHTALLMHQETAALHLLDRGASALAVTTNIRRRSALHLACLMDLPEVVLSLLMKYAHPVDAVDGRGRTPLFDSKSSVRISSMLLEYGANPQHMDMLGWTALHDAVRAGCPKVVAALVMAGADIGVRTKDDGLTVLERAEDLWDYERKSEGRDGQARAGMQDDESANHDDGDDGDDDNDWVNPEWLKSVVERARSERRQLNLEKDSRERKRIDRIVEWTEDQRGWDAAINDANQASLQAAEAKVKKGEVCNDSYRKCVEIKPEELGPEEGNAEERKHVCEVDGEHDSQNEQNGYVDDLSKGANEDDCRHNDRTRSRDLLADRSLNTSGDRSDSDFELISREDVEDDGV